VIAFTCLTGRRPFEGTNLGDVLVKICRDEIPLASKLAPHLPPAIDAFFERALSRSVDGRFGSARDLAGALSAIAETSPDSPAQVRARMHVVPRVEETLSAVAAPGTLSPKRTRARAIILVFAAISVLSIVVWATLTKRHAPAQTTQPTAAIAPPSQTQSAAPVISAAPVVSSPASQVARPRPTRAPTRTSGIAPATHDAPTVDPKFGLPTGQP